MIPKKDLRVGNIIDVGVVEQLREDRVGVGIININNINGAVSGDISFFDYDEVSPIPLTEEIIKKCGFQIRKPLPKNGDYTLRVGFNEKTGSLLIWKIKDCYELPELKYLHQLQNLWYLLKNEELNYSP